MIKLYMGGNMQNFINNLDYIDLEKINNDIFLHYTSIENLDSISKNGLQPKIGKNSKVIERTKKVFFTVGDKGALVIMDSWLKWLVAKPISNFIYYIGAFLLKIPFFPNIIHKIIIKFNRNKKKYRWSYKKLKEILDNSVYLVLDLEEKVDFSYDDIDEVKKFSHYPPSFIENLYAFDSDVFDEKMEYWNMHTLSNKIIETDKIHILKLKGKTRTSDILKILIEDNMDFVKENCEQLYKYYNYNYLGKEN